MSMNLSVTLAMTELENKIIQTIRTAYPQVQETTGYQRLIVKEIIFEVLKPEHMKHTAEVKGLIEALNKYKNQQAPLTGYIAKEALKPFEKENNENS